ncbi:MAG: hypothetical protein ACPGHU_03020, partial [Porticoccaceae bacterium]
RDIEMHRLFENIKRAAQTQIKAMLYLLSAHGKKAKFSTTQQANQWQVEPEDEESQNQRSNNSNKEERGIGIRGQNGNHPLYY